MSLGQVSSPQRDISPIPPGGAADLGRLTDPRLNPFPGLQQLHEQRQFQRKMSMGRSLSLGGGFAAAGTMYGSTPTTPLTHGYFSTIPVSTGSGSRRHSWEDDRGMEVVMIHRKASQSGIKLPQTPQSQPPTPSHQHPQQSTECEWPVPHDNSFDGVPLSCRCQRWSIRCQRFRGRPLLRGRDILMDMPQRA